MVAMHEERVSTLAHRVGLHLARTSAAAGAIRYQLVEPETRMVVYPGGYVDGVELPDVEDWLRFPWE